MSDNGRYAAENTPTGAQTPRDAAPLTRRQLRDREAAAALLASHQQPPPVAATPMPVVPAGMPAAAMPAPAMPAPAMPAPAPTVSQAPLLPQTPPPAGLPAATLAGPPADVRASIQPPVPVAPSDVFLTTVAMTQPVVAVQAASAPPVETQQLSDLEELFAAKPSLASDSPILPVPHAPYPTRGSRSSSGANASTGPGRSNGRGSGRKGTSAAATAGSASFAIPAAFSTPAGFSMARVTLRRPSRKVVASKLLSMGAMIFAAALLVGTTVPANAFISNDTEIESMPAALKAVEGQSLEVSDDASQALAQRDKFTVTSYSELLRQKYGNISYTYNVTTGAVRWPFPFAVPISSGFGDRVAPCRGCSSNHMGLDFTPGAGTPIYAIADGVVSTSEISLWGFGNAVIIDHEIKGQKVQSLYAHMQMNSSPLLVGDEIKVGDFIGLVGSTGASSGAHLHLEIIIDEEPVNPFTWLKANATN